MKQRKVDGRVISWEYDVPLINNWYMLRDVVRFVLLTGALVLVIFMIIAFFAGDGDPNFFKDALMATGIGLIVLFVLMYIAMLVMRNKVKHRYILSEHGIYAASVDKYVNNLTKAAMAVGSMAGNATLSGAGLLAFSRENITYDFNDIHEIRYDPKRHVITLRNSWRAIDRIYCTEENYDEVASLLKELF